jgi:hypothetical protein
MLPNVSEPSAAGAAVAKTSVAGASGAEAQGFQSPGWPMRRRNTAKTISERIADDVLTIIDSGLANRPGPYPLLVDGRAILNWQMGRADIIALVKRKHGRKWAS